MHNKPNTDGVKGNRIRKRVPSKILNESFYAELNNIDETVTGGDGAAVQYYPTMHRDVKNKIRRGV